jgi:tRNA-Thr(GGU) m(6)t(6)A37 methyltransferase TsaA
MSNNLIYIGKIHTPYKELSECPMNVSPDGPACSIEIYDDFKDGLFGLKKSDRILILYWLDRSERTVGIAEASGRAGIFGTFGKRTPVRPNPIGVSEADIVDITENSITVRGLDCLDGTPLLDIKPVL